MRESRRALVGLMAVATTMLAVTGCKSDATQRAVQTSATSAAQGPAVQSLAAAADKLRGDSLEFTLTNNGKDTLKITGRADEVNMKMAVVMELVVAGQSFKSEVIRLGEDIWVRRRGMPSIPDNWMHTRVSKLMATSMLRKSLQDPAGVHEFLRTVTEAQSGAGELGFRGTMNLTKLAGFNAAGIPFLFASNDAAATFRATVDARGRLVAMTVVASDANKDSSLGEMRWDYFGFGTAVTITPPPAAEVIELPAGMPLL